MSYRSRQAIGWRVAVELELGAMRLSSWSARFDPTVAVLRCLGYLAGASLGVVSMRRAPAYLGWRLSGHEIVAAVEGLVDRGALRRLDIPPESVEVLLESEAHAAAARMTKQGLTGEHFSFVCPGCAEEAVTANAGVCDGCRRRIGYEEG